MLAHGGGLGYKVWSSKPVGGLLAHHKGKITMAGKYALKKSKNAKFLFNLLASNGQAILSSEMYEAKASALNGIESVRKNGVDAARFDKLVAKDGSPYFTLKATNGQVIGQSEMYTTTAARDNGIASVMKNAADAVLDDQTGALA